MLKPIFLRLVLGLCAFGLLGRPFEAQAASKAKVFILTSTYGVMTGTLAGLASLAFVQSPGKHGRNVAIGASVGLYAGILLGAYIVYLTPDPKKVKEKRQKEKLKENEKEIESEENPLNLEPQRSEIPRLVPLVYADAKGHPQVGISYSF